MKSGAKKRDMHERVSEGIWSKDRSAFHKEIDTAVVEIVARANDLQLARFQGVHQDRVRRAAQPHHHALHVLAHGYVEHVIAGGVGRGRAFRLQSGRNDGLNHLADAARKVLSGLAPRPLANEGWPGYEPPLTEG